MGLHSWIYCFGSASLSFHDPEGAVSSMWHLVLSIKQLMQWLIWVDRQSIILTPDLLVMIKEKWQTFADSHFWNVRFCSFSPFYSINILQEKFYRDYCSVCFLIIYNRSKKREHFSSCVKCERADCRSASVIVYICIFIQFATKKRKQEMSHVVSSSVSCTCLRIFTYEVQYMPLNRNTHT